MFKSQITKYFIVILVWLVASLSVGCASSKTKVRTATHKVDSITETGKRIIIKKGDSVVYVPVVKYKDTTIIVKRNNIGLKIKYNKSGQVDKINCYEEALKILEDYIKRQKTETQTTTNIKQKQPETIKDIWFLYIGIILTILVVVNKLLK